MNEVSIAIFAVDVGSPKNFAWVAPAGMVMGAKGWPAYLSLSGPCWA